MLLLASEPTENPELYDFLLGSGVVLWDDGVEVLRGSIEGDREAGRSDAGGGGGCKAIELFSDSWTVWGSGMKDRLFNLCVSVGLTVLAPKPDT